MKIVVNFLQWSYHWLKTLFLIGLGLILITFGQKIVYQRHQYNWAEPISQIYVSCPWPYHFSFPKSPVFTKPPVLVAKQGLRLNRPFCRRFFDLKRLYIYRQQLKSENIRLQLYRLMLYRMQEARLLALRHQLQLTQSDGINIPAHRVRRTPWARRQWYEPQIVPNVQINNRPPRPYH